MKRKKRESIEALLLALPCALQTCEQLTKEERAAGWRIFDRILRAYIDDKHRSRKGVRHV